MSELPRPDQQQLDAAYRLAVEMWVRGFLRVDIEGKLREQGWGASAAAEIVTYAPSVASASRAALMAGEKGRIDTVVLRAKCQPPPPGLQAQGFPKPDSTSTSPARRDRSLERQPARMSRRARKAWRVLFLLAAPLCLLVVPIEIYAERALIGLLTLVCVFWLLARGKSTILFLRRFRESDVNRIISETIDTGLGSRYRVITLDDSFFSPLEVPRWIRRFSRYGLPLIALTIAVLFLSALAVANSWLEEIKLSPGGGFGAVGVILLIIVVIMFLGLCSLVALVGLFIMFILLMAHRWRVSSQSRLSVQNKGDLKPILKRVLLLSSRFRGLSILAPQATVVRVHDTMWQETVRVLLCVTEAAIIDLSVPSANLLWEIETVFEAHLEKVVLIGDREKVDRWYASAAGPGNQAGPGSGILRALDGQTVLLYDSSRPRELGSFRKRLIGALRVVAADPEDKAELIRQEGLAPTVVDISIGLGRTALFYLIILFGILLPLYELLFRWLRTARSS